MKFELKVTTDEGGENVWTSEIDYSKDNMDRLVKEMVVNIGNKFGVRCTSRYCSNSAICKKTEVKDVLGNMYCNQDCLYEHIRWLSLNDIGTWEKLTGKTWGEWRKE